MTVRLVCQGDVEVPINRFTYGSKLVHLQTCGDVVELRQVAREHVDTALDFWKALDSGKLDDAEMKVTPENVWHLACVASALKFERLDEAVRKFLAERATSVSDALRMLEGGPNRDAEEFLSNNAVALLQQVPSGKIPLPVMHRLLEKSLAKVGERTTGTETMLCDFLLNYMNTSDNPDIGLLAKLLDFEKLPIDRVARLLQCDKVKNAPATSLSVHDLCAIMLNAKDSKDRIEAQDREIAALKDTMNNMKEQYEKLIAEVRALIPEGLKNGADDAKKTEPLVSRGQEITPWCETDLIQWLMDIGLAFDRRISFSTSSNSVADLLNPGKNTTYRSADLEGAFVELRFAQAQRFTGFKLVPAEDTFPNNLEVIFDDGRGEPAIVKIVDEAALQQGQPFEMRLEAPVEACKIQVAARGKNWSNTNVLCLKGIEFYSQEHNGGVLAALPWDKSAELGKIFEFSARDFDGSQLCRGVEYGAVCTDGQDANQWVQLDLMGGRFCPKMYYLEFVKGHESKGWKLEGLTRDNSWRVVHQGSSLEVPIAGQLHNLGQAAEYFSAFRLVSTNKNFDDTESLQIARLQLYGIYDMVLL